MLKSSNDKILSALQKYIKIVKIANLGKEHITTPNNFKLLINYEELKNLGKLEELFNIYIDLFSNELGEGYYCDCGKIYPTNTKDPFLFICDECGKTLKEFYELNNLIHEYKSKFNWEYNIMTYKNKIVGFSCGGCIEKEIKYALLGDHYTIYKKKYPNIDQVKYLIYQYFNNSTNIDSLDSSIYFADAGGIIPKFRNSLDGLIFIIRPLLWSAYRKCNGSLISINHLNTTMYKINILLGYDEIARYGDLVYMGIKDVSSILILYQNYTSKEVANIFHLLQKEIKNKKEFNE